ncbi:inorganic phosphate transporter [Actinocorallia longicatena]|uniref:PiT family inorganic phosphate transporter n=1 Tax=Actinocorallia longicatena TaxID=111803 RepID=A0ABP6QNY2_9ACTN
MLTVAIVFALVTGANDGGALLTNGLKLAVPRVWVLLTTLTVCVVAVPAFLTTAVASTFTDRLVSFASPVPVAVGVCSALAVVLVLTRAGRPTSLTLATVGGLTGAGIGAGLPVSYGWVGYVLAVGLAAPLAGGLLAAPVVRMLNLDGLRGAHVLGFLGQCLAYAANDGQKMLAVFLITAGSHLWVTPLIGLLFAIGALYGLPRTGALLGGRLLAVRPVHAVAAEVSSAGAVLGSAALGAPVSMTQSMAGGLIGAGGAGRVRWEAASRLVLAWMLTLPGAVALAAVLTWSVT